MTETKRLGANEYRADHPTGGAAAGNFYESTVYRLAWNGGCFEAATTLHTTNVGNYDPGTVTEFEKSKAETIFNAILETLELTT